MLLTPFSNALEVVNNELTMDGAWSAVTSGDADMRGNQVE